MQIIENLETECMRNVEFWYLVYSAKLNSYLHLRKTQFLLSTVQINIHSEGYETAIRLSSIIQFDLHRLNCWSEQIKNLLKNSTKYFGITDIKYSAK